MDCTISSTSGIAVARMSTIADQPLRLCAIGSTSFVGAFVGNSATAPAMGSHRAQTAPKAADKTATGKPNKATRVQAASRMEAAAMTTGENATRP